MNTELTTTTPQAKQTALGIMAARLNLEPEKMMNVLKSTVFSACRNNEELAALVVVANEYGLNPLLKELYAFPAKGGGIVPMVSIDGWVRMVNNHPQLDGIEFDTIKDSAGKLEAVTCRIHRKDRTRPVEVTEYLSECKRSTEPWKMEHRMLRHKALMQCARYAFGFSGITDEDEARDIGMRDVTPPAALAKTIARAETVNPFANMPAPEPQPEPAPQVVEAEIVPETKPKTARQAAGHIVSATQAGEGWMVVIRGADKEIAAHADNEVGERANELTGAACWVTLKKRDGKVVLTAIELKEEGGEA
jgi:hypothetical protein